MCGARATSKTAACLSGESAARRTLPRRRRVGALRRPPPLGTVRPSAATMRRRPVSGGEEALEPVGELPAHALHRQQDRLYVSFE